MAGASVETYQFVVPRSLGGRLWSVLDMGNRLPRMRGRSHRCIHISKVLCTPRLWTKTVALDVAVAQPGDAAHGMVVVDRRSWADTTPRVTYGPEGLDDYLGSTLTYSQVPPRANAAVKVVTVLTNVNASEFRKELAFRFRKNAMRYFTKY